MKEKVKKTVQQFNIGFSYIFLILEKQLSGTPGKILKKNEMQVNQIEHVKFVVDRCRQKKIIGV